MLSNMTIVSPPITADTKKNTGMNGVYHSGCTLPFASRNNPPSADWCSVDRITPKTVLKKFGPLQAVGEAVRWSWDMTRQTFDVIGRLVTAQISPKTMMGPLGIAQASGDAARGGAGSLFFLVAVISLQVGILNLLPLVPLDGGHLAILALEGVARRDLSPTVKSWVMNAGAAMIFLLIGLVLYSDISKLDFVRKLIP